MKFSVSVHIAVVVGLTLPVVAQDVDNWRYFAGSEELADRFRANPQAQHVVCASSSWDVETSGYGEAASNWFVRDMGSDLPGEVVQTVINSSNGVLAGVCEYVAIPWFSKDSRHEMTAEMRYMIPIALN